MLFLTHSSEDLKIFPDLSYSTHNSVYVKLNLQKYKKVIMAILLLSHISNFLTGLIYFQKRLGS
ncbi:hypothetical protein SuUB23_18840 [Streptococcus uberis]